jgi:hypothetical protein
VGSSPLELPCVEGLPTNETINNQSSRGRRGIPKCQNEIKTCDKERVGGPGLVGWSSHERGPSGVAGMARSRSVVEVSNIVPLAMPGCLPGRGGSAMLEGDEINLFLPVR